VKEQQYNDDDNCLWKERELVLGERVVITDSRLQCVPSVSCAWQVLSERTEWKNVKFW